jgi:hypothetical protein
MPRDAEPPSCRWEPGLWAGSGRDLGGRVAAPQGAYKRLVTMADVTDATDFLLRNPASTTTTWLSTLA